MRKLILLLALAASLGTSSCSDALAVVNTTTNSISYVGTGAVSTYTVPFPFASSAQLVVTQAGVIKALGTDYTVTGVGSNNGGSITLTAGALGSGVKLVISRQVGLTQPYSFRAQSYYSPALHEQAMDNLEYQIQAISAAQADGGSSGGVATGVAPGAIGVSEPIIGDGSAGNALAFDYTYAGTWTQTQTFAPNSGNAAAIAATGHGTGAGGAFTGGSSGGDGLDAYGSTLSGNGVVGTATGAGFVGVTGYGGSGSGAFGGIFRISGSGSGSGSLSVAGSGGNGIGSTGYGNGSGAGVSGIGGATGPGGSFTGGATSGDGIDAAAQTAGYGVQGTGAGSSGVGVVGLGTGASTSVTSTKIGVYGVGGAAAPGVYGQAGAGSTYAGVVGYGGTSAISPGVFGSGGATAGSYGVAGAGAGTNNGGVSGVGVGTGNGVDGTGGSTGYALAAVASNASKGTLFLSSQTAPSTTNALGSVYVDSTLKSPLWSNGTSWTRPAQGIQATFSNSTAKTFTVESGSVGCVCNSISHTYTAQCAISSTTATITSGTSNSDVWSCIYW